ncbi:hypothetical protein NDU88_011933 [Pleurodeles waltl]|uniref:Uncharacterized protein n=1 Tax=Pleurodeles waltl TaxID=8319 RepID=A0AAV7S5V5_PLEWA|nr:hypothetical protein NDU88_011933 [Pleurodeles waltl]
MTPETPPGLYWRQQEVSEYPRHLLSLMTRETPRALLEAARGVRVPEAPAQPHDTPPGLYWRQQEVSEAPAQPHDTQRPPAGSTGGSKRCPRHLLSLMTPETPPPRALLEAARGVRALLEAARGVRVPEAPAQPHDTPRPPGIYWRQQEVSEYPRHLLSLMTPRDPPQALLEAARGVRVPEAPAQPHDTPRPPGIYWRQQEVSEYPRHLLSLMTPRDPPRALLEATRDVRGTCSAS